MDNYKRVVSYLYKYKNGNKGKNSGYVRAEKQGTSIKIYISLREEERTDGMLSLSFYMPKEKEPGMQAFCFGHCTMKDGTAEFVFKGSEREFFEAAAADAWQEEKGAVRFFEKYPRHPVRLKLEQISGVLCLWEEYEEEYFCSQWKDEDISPKELTWPAMGEKERGKEQEAEAQGEQEAGRQEAEAQGERGVERQEAEAQGEWRGEKQEEDVKGYGNREPERSEEEVWEEGKPGVEHLEAEVQREWRVESREEEAGERGERKPESPEIGAWEEGKQGAESPEAEVQREWRVESREEEAQGQGERKPESPEAGVQGEWRGKKQEDDVWEYGNRKPESPEIEGWKEGKQGVESPEAQAQKAGNPVRFQGKIPDPVNGDENMGKRITTASFEQIFKDYPRLMPFSETQGILDCVRMEPQDIGLFPIKEWELLNNPFLLHGYYCFRHLAYMKKLEKSKKMESKSEEREGYRLGVPGNYTNRERILARLSGFPEFLPAEGDKTEPGTFGYWCRKLELS